MKGSGIFDSNTDLTDMGKAENILTYYETKVNGLIQDIDNNNLVNLLNNKFLDGSGSKGYNFTLKLSDLITKAGDFNRKTTKYLQEVEEANKKYDQEEASKLLELKSRAERDQAIHDQLVENKKPGNNIPAKAENQSSSVQPQPQTLPKQETAKAPAKDKSVERTLDEVLNVDDITKLAPGDYKKLQDKLEGMKINFDKVKEDSPDQQFYKLERLINKNIMPSNQFNSIKEPFTKSHDKNKEYRDYIMNSIILQYNNKIDELKKHFKDIESYVGNMKRTEQKPTVFEDYKKGLSEHIKNNVQNYIVTSKNTAITKENKKLKEKDLDLNKDDNIHAFSDQFKEIMK